MISQNVQNACLLQAMTFSNEKTEDLSSLIYAAIGKWRCCINYKFYKSQIILLTCLLYLSFLYFDKILSRVAVFYDLVSLAMSILFVDENTKKLSSII